MPDIRFTVLDVEKKVPKGAPYTAYLVEDRWDDWGEYRTMFQLYVFDGEGSRVEAGSVKIGQVGLLPGGRIDDMTRYPKIPREFTALPEGFFSIGQAENYYESLNQLDDALRDAILVALSDCAFNIDLFEEHAEERVMVKSLLREVRAQNVRHKLRRLARGDAILSKYEFSFALPQHDDASGDPPKFEFVVNPESNPPSNIHVVIGRNGVGKTRFMQLLVDDISELDQPPEVHGFQQLGDNRREWSFSGIVVVSFSAFDFVSTGSADTNSSKVRRVGMETDDGAGRRRSMRERLTDQFVKGLGECRKGARKGRLLGALGTLENDPLFEEANVGGLFEFDDDEWMEQAKALFDRLSSGHAIILLTMTRLVELVDENTLVLLDEPESHLHPPLLSAFVRALSNLLTSRNGVAIIATHSPVVLQEVPRECAWIMRRVGWNARIERPENETFGENVGSLTKDVFGLEVTGTGFHELLEGVVQLGFDYEAIVGAFNGQLGIEARAILRALIADRDGDEDAEDEE